MLASIRPSSLIAQLSKSASRVGSIPFTRAFSTTQHQHNRPVCDPTYPFPLYLHPLPLTTTTTPTPDYALSFLPTAPHNHQVIGYLKQTLPQRDLPHLREGEPLIKPNKFTENEAFSKVLHEVIKANLDQDPMLTSVLQLQLEGWTHVADYRNPAPYGRIPLPEDIFGSVQIVDGVIQPGTYQRMPTHRIVSSLGLFQLSDYLHEKLVEHLQNLQS
ncbi:hypothetical protein CPB97_010587 [Podila verticillata]|nr:hypothetical protein CPB97_010587 [Podila verticillata]